MPDEEDESNAEVVDIGRTPGLSDLFKAYKFGIAVALHLADQNLNPHEIFLHDGITILYKIANGEVTIRGTPADERADIFRSLGRSDYSPEEIEELREHYAAAEIWIPRKIREDRDHARRILGWYWREPDAKSREG